MPQGPLSNLAAQQFHRTSTNPRMFQYYTLGETMFFQEAMFIHANEPSLNRNLGKYQLPHVGQLLTGHTTITSPTIQPYPLPIPYWNPPSQVPQPPNSSLPTKGGGICAFIGKYLNGGA